MANMSYCRFQNTSDDLSDCVEALADMESIEQLPDDERRAAARMYKNAQQFIEDYENLLGIEAD